MFPNIPRHCVQLASIFLMTVAIISILVLPGGWEIAPVFGFFSLWVMVMSESFLLGKVQYEMSVSLEALRKKQEIEVQDLLFYLRQSKLGNSPWSSIEAAQNYIQKIGFPAIITDSGGACISVNAALYDSLGYGKELVGELCHSLHDSDSYGVYVQGISINISKGIRFMHSRLTMIDANGGKHEGTVAITMLPDMRTAVGIWYPDDDGIMQKTLK